MPKGKKARETLKARNATIARLQRARDIHLAPPPTPPTPPSTTPPETYPETHGAINMLKAITFLRLVEEEIVAAVSKNTRPIASLHEGYAIMREEVDEVWDIVRQKPSERDLRAALKELVQVAAMAARTAVDTGLEL